MALEVTAQVREARRRWQYRGQRRPAFAAAPGPGQRSVWDFPRPPVVEPVPGTMRVEAGGAVLAQTRRGVRVLETAGAPTCYFPPDDVAVGWLRSTGRRTLCEWKGLARQYAWRQADPAAWVYEQTFPEFDELRGWFAFYPGALACFVGDERVAAQPGGYYGGWVTADLSGPIKGEPGSADW